MLCSSCFKQKVNCIQLSCDHNVCFSCLPKQSSSQNILRYQCQTCLANHQIDLSQKYGLERNNFRQKSLKSSQKSEITSEFQCIFCWSCHEAITINEYIKGKTSSKLGRHHDHSVQTYEQAIPQIKNMMLGELKKSSSLKEYLQDNKSNLQNNNLKRNCENLLDKINQFFHKQIQIIQRKRQKIIIQLQRTYQQGLQRVHNTIQILDPMIEDIQSLQIKISNFVNDRTPITEINPVSAVLEILEQYTQKLKQRKFVIPELPQFIIKSSLKESIETACSLFMGTTLIPQVKTNQSSIKKFKIREEFNCLPSRLSMQEEQKTISKINSQLFNDPTVNRKVKLLQKVKGKMKYTSSMCSTSFA